MSVGSIILATAIGLFFAISGWHKTMHPVRHTSLKGTLAHDLHLSGTSLELVTYWVAVWELVAGAGAALAWVWAWVGLPILTHLSLFPLAVICVVAGACEGVSQVRQMEPLNCFDRGCCWLYLPESLLLLGIIGVWLGA